MYKNYYAYNGQIKVYTMGYSALLQPNYVCMDYLG